MNSHIGELNLHLAFHEEDSQLVPQLRLTIEEQFINGVLNALEKSIDAKFGSESILRVRELNVHWGIDQQQLTDAMYIEQLGRELANQFEQEICQYSEDEFLRPEHTQSVVLFENSAHQWAALLSDQLQTDITAWFYQRCFKDQDIWTTVLAAGTSHLRQTLVYLERMQTLEPVIKKIDIQHIKQAVNLLPIEDWPEVAVKVLRVKQLKSVPPARKKKDPAAEVINETQLSNEKIKHQINQALQIRKKGQSQPELDRLYENQQPEYVKNDLASLASPESITEIQKQEKTNVITNAQSISGIQFSPEILQTSRDNTRLLSRSNPAQTEIAADSMIEDEAFNIDIDQNTSPMQKDSYDSPVFISELEIETDSACVVTRYAGMFYLLNPILELELPEMLWCAGINEGDFICHMCRLLLGEAAADDPAPRVLSGTVGDFDPELAVIPDWAEEEIRNKSMAALRQMHTRRATEIFSAEELDFDIENISTNLIALPTQNLHDPLTAGLVSHCAAVVLHAFAICFNKKIDRDVFQKLVQISGRIEQQQDEINICMPMEAIDTRIRLAGLDNNPGYLPWLKSKMVFEYEERE